MEGADPRCWGWYRLMNETCLPDCPFAPVFPPPTLPQDGAAFGRYMSRYQPTHMADNLVTIHDLQDKHRYIDMLDFEIVSSLEDRVGGTLAIVNNLNAQNLALNSQIVQLHNQIANLQNQLQNQNQTVEVLTNARHAFLQLVESIREGLIVKT